MQVRQGRNEGEPLSSILRRKNHHLEKRFTHLEIFWFLLAECTLELGWVRRWNKKHKGEIKYYPKFIFLQINRAKTMQGVLGTKSNTGVEESLYLFAHFSVTKRGNQCHHLTGNRWRTAELFGTVCTGGMSGQERGLLPSDAGPAVPEAALTSSRAQGQSGRGLRSPAWLLCLPWLHLILFTPRNINFP